MSKKFNAAFVFILAIISIRFFEPNFLNISLINYLVFFFQLLAIVLSVPYVMPRQAGFVLPVQLLVGSTVVSVAMAYFSWQQPLADSLVATTPYLTWITFFYLMHAKVPVKLIEKAALIYGAIYAILFFYQLYKSPVVLFGKSLWGDEFTVNRGITRIIFPGGGIFVLAVFIAITKLSTQAKLRGLWMMYALLGIIIPFLQVTRQFILGIAVIYLFHFMGKQQLHRKLITLAILLGAVFWIQQADNELVKGISEATEENLGEGKNYIRVLAGAYFLSDFSPNTISQILGNGVPYYEVSYYGIFISRLNDAGYFMEDVGIIGLYAMFGILAVAAFIIIWYKSFTVSLPKEYYYVKYYFWFILMTSLTSFNIYYPSYLVSSVFALYVFQSLLFRKITLVLQRPEPVSNVMAIKENSL